MLLVQSESYFQALEKLLDRELLENVVSFFEIWLERMMNLDILQRIGFCFSLFT